MQRLRRALIVLAFVVVSLTAPLLACPLCGESLNDGGKPSSLARGFAWSILLMLSVPAVLVTGGGVLLVRREAARRKEQTSDEQADPTEPPSR